VSWERVDYDYKDGRPNPEKIFQEIWNRENSEGRDLAQKLFIVSKKSAVLFDGPDQDQLPYHDFISGDSVCIYNLTEREQCIIATIIQWLGTNVGFGFLQEVLKQSGYFLTSLKKELPAKKKLNRYDFLKKKD